MSTRFSLLDSAERAVRQRGFHGFSYADLAREIGIRKASIHHHFPSKANLGEALIERYNSRFFEQLSEIAKAKTDAAGQIQAYLDIYRAALADGEQVCLCVALSAGRAHLSQDILDHLDAFHHQSITWLERVFETAHEDGSIAHLSEARADAHATLALVEGAQLLARSREDVTLFDRAVSALQSRLSPVPND